MPVPTADPAKLCEGLLNYIEQKHPSHIRELARTSLDATQAVKENCVTLARVVDDVERVAKDAVQQVRSSRMSIVADCSTAVNAMRDVRQFFLGPDYEKEQKRLSEFVDLCERLKALKDSGFLDTVADTMIRLASCGK